MVCRRVGEWSCAAASQLKSAFLGPNAEVGARHVFVVRRISALPRVRLLQRVQWDVPIQQLSISGTAIDVITSVSSWIVDRATTTTANACPFDGPRNLCSICPMKKRLDGSEAILGRICLHGKKAAEVTSSIGNPAEFWPGARHYCCEQNR
jgi:hypothetical protein